jgi:hypothetical protein
MAPMPLAIQEATTLSEMAEKAKQECMRDIKSNLILHGEFPISELDRGFARMEISNARKWQAKEPPGDLYFNHGQYIDRGGRSGRAFLVDELRRKHDSNRACLSLVSMPDIVNSGDEPIPSFLILQFSFIEDGFRKLQVNAYFRALEVHNFLPINIAEICDIISDLAKAFPDMRTFELTIFAFRAYADKFFRCLTKTALDMAKPVDIALAVERNEISTIKKWIESQLLYSDSVLSIAGLEYLCDALVSSKLDYAKELHGHLSHALLAYRAIRDIRRASSYSHRLEALQNSVKTSLKSACDVLDNYEGKETA